MATIRKRGTSWQAIVRRKEYSKSQTFRTKTDALNWATELEAKIYRNTAGLPESAKAYQFDELVQSYRQHSLESVRGLGRTKDNVLTRIEIALGHFSAQLTRNQIAEFAENRRARGVKPATLNIDMIYIETVLQHAIDVMDINIDLQPIKSVKKQLNAAGATGKADERDRRPSEDELDQLINHFDTSPSTRIAMKQVILFAIATGMRLGEICKIEWSDLDEEKEKLTIRDRKHPAKKRNHNIPLVKNGSFDPIAILSVQRLITGNLKRIFPYSPQSVSTSFRRACKKLSIKDLRFHDLRHDGISRLFENGFQIQHVMLISGHSDLKQLSRYTNTRADDVLRHQEQMQKLTPTG